jgi:hypothetical protein
MSQETTGEIGERQPPNRGWLGPAVGYILENDG